MVVVKAAEYILIVIKIPKLQRNTEKTLLQIPGDKKFTCTFLCVLINKIQNKHLSSINDVHEIFCFTRQILI